MLNIQDLASQVQSIAQKLNIPKYDIYGSAADSTSVQVDRGEAKQVKASQSSGVTVRAWNPEGRLGVTTTTDIDPEGLELALKTAYEASFFGSKENIPDFSPEATAPIADLKTDKCAPAGVPTLIETLLAAEKELMDAHTAIESVPYNGLSQRDVDRFYLNSAGAMRAEGGSYTSLYLYTKTEQEGRKPRSAGAFRINYDLDRLDVTSCVTEAAEKTISHLNYEKIKTGKYRVVFSPEAFLDLLGAFGNLYNAQNILDKQSLSNEESLGTTIASPLLCVADDARHSANIGQSAFDDEGTPTRRISLIENGILKSFLHSSGTAKRLGATPTGHANIGAKVTVGPHFYHVSGNGGSQDLTLDTAENVVYIDELSALHAGVQALQGSFSLPFDGWLINNGNRISIESATVAGDFREVLKSIVQVDATEKLTPGGVCPHIWVDSLSITGEE
jgi:PmbA protein